MRKWVLWMVFVAVLAPGSADAGVGEYVELSARKLASGLHDVVLSPVEIPCGMVEGAIEGDGMFMPVVGLVGGVFTGSFQAVVRLVTGAQDIATFPFVSGEREREFAIYKGRDLIQARLY